MDTTLCQFINQGQMVSAVQMPEKGSEFLYLLSSSTSYSEFSTKNDLRARKLNSGYVPKLMNVLVSLQHICIRLLSVVVGKLENPARIYQSLDFLPNNRQPDVLRCEHCNNLVS